MRHRSRVVTQRLAFPDCFHFNRRKQGAWAPPVADQPSSPPPPRRKRRWLRALLFRVLALAVALLAARLALPSYLQSYVNKVLDQSTDYDGRVGEIDLHLWRGAYAIHDLKIVKTTHTVPVPFFESRLVEFSIDWRTLVRGQARGKIHMQSPRINFVHAPSAGDTQTGADQPWLSIIHDLFPFRIDSAEIADGEVRFRTFHTDPQVDVYLSDVKGAVTNLTNVENITDPLLARVKARGAAMEGGRFELDMSLDPQSHRPNFTLAARLLDVDVIRLNSLARAYGDFDFESGSFDFVAEVAITDGYMQGYAKPLFRDFTVVSFRDLKGGDPLQFFWEALVGLVGEVFKNQSREQFGTRITLEGDFDDPRTNILEIVGNVLRNAFVRAYLPRIESRARPDAGPRDDALDRKVKELSDDKQ